MNDSFSAVRQRRHQLVYLACWPHCRRYFIEALQASPKEQRGHYQLAARFIALIGQLYHVEADARRDGVDSDELKRRRSKTASPCWRPSSVPHNRIDELLPHRWSPS